MNDSFRTVSGTHSAEIERIQGSRFIGDVARARAADAAERFIEVIRRREPKATHHCWAYRLQAAGGIERSSDDGEPSGTAGAPILRQILSRDLTDVVVVVTRYYGGTKLGTGGLVRAYGQAASVVLDGCEIVERIMSARVRLRFGYDDTAAAMAVLHRFEARVAHQDYGRDTVLEVMIRRAEAENLVAAFADALGGRGEAAILGT